MFAKGSSHRPGTGITDPCAEENQGIDELAVRQKLGTVNAGNHDRCVKKSDHRIHHLIRMILRKGKHINRHVQQKQSHDGDKRKRIRPVNERHRIRRSPRQKITCPRHHTFRLSVVKQSQIVQDADHKPCHFQNAAFLFGCIMNAKCPGQLIIPDQRTHHQDDSKGQAPAKSKANRHNRNDNSTDDSFLHSCCLCLP